MWKLLGEGVGPRMGPSPVRLQLGGRGAGDHSWVGRSPQGSQASGCPAVTHPEAGEPGTPDVLETCFRETHPFLHVVGSESGVSFAKATPYSKSKTSNRFSTVWGNARDLYFKM